MQRNPRAPGMTVNNLRLTKYRGVKSEAPIPGNARTIPDGSVRTIPTGDIRTIP